MAGVRRQLGLQGIEKRAEFVFVESSKKMIETGAECVFGGRSNARLAALPLLDPLLRVEQAVNRVFGGMIKATCGNAGEKDAMVERLSGTGAKNSERHRTRVIEVLGQVMAFDQLCSRSTGVNPNTLVCSAVSMGLEHLYVSAPHTSEGMLKRSHCKVIFRQAFLFAVRETRTQESTNDKAALSGSAKFESAASDVVAKISKAPSYVWSEAQRERRKNIPDQYVSDSEVEPAKWSGACNKDEAQRETRLIWSLYRAGIDRKALLSLPLHTLEQIGNESIGSAALNQQDRQRLDTEIVGVDDMAEDEVLAYISTIAKEG
ncbi:hypothetical protein H4217_007858 [Coemansia sp. RSA 1939]|nr:hypothetical protein H4217_007858 [Coemansia sp. RSA 1939]